MNTENLNPASATNTTSSARFSDGVTHLTTRRGLPALHRDAWSAVWAHPKIFVGLPLAVWALVLAVWSAFGALMTANPMIGTPLFIVAAVLSIVPLGAITFTALVAVRELGQGREPEMKALLVEGWTMFKNSFGALFIAGVLSALGSMLFLIPGLILMTRYMLVAPVVVFEGLSGQSAVNRSSELVQGFGTGRLMAYGFVAWLIYAGMGEIGQVALHYMGVSGATSLGAWAFVVAGVPSVIVAAVASIAATLVYTDVVGKDALVPFGRALRVGRHDAKAPRGSGMLGLGAALLVGVLSLTAAVYLPLSRVSDFRDKAAAKAAAHEQATARTPDAASVAH